MLLVFLLLILIGNLHPHLIKLAHPLVCKLRLPRNHRLRRCDRMHLPHTVRISKLLQEGIVHNLFPLRVLLAQKTIAYLHIIIPCARYDSARPLTPK